MKYSTLFSCAIFLSLFIAFLPTVSFAQNYIQSFKTGRIDWSNGIIESVAIAKPPKKAKNEAQARALAEKQAIILAHSNLKALIGRIRIDANSLLKSLLERVDKIRLQLEEMSKKAQVVDKRYEQDGSVMVTLALGLNAEFVDLVLPRHIRRIDPVRQSQISGNGSKEAFTGLIIDCRGFRVHPALAPRIIDEDNNEVYGSTYASRENALIAGIAAYAKGLHSAETHPRAGKSPLIVKGIRAANTGPCDIVVSRADASKIRGTAGNLKMLQKCRVVIVLD